MKKILKWFGICLGVAILFIAIAAVALILLVNKEMTASPMEITPYHPFRSAEAKERYLQSYDMWAKRWPVPSETRTVDTSYGQTFVRISGPVDAPPLVLLPGANATSLMWTPNIEALSERHRTYAVDNIYDFGRSVYTRPIENADDFAQWLDELFSRLELGDHFSCMGLSYGGWLTSQYALRFPNRLDKIVLLAPASTILPLRSELLIRAVLCLLPHRYFVKSMMYWILEDSVKKDEASRALVEEAVDGMFLGLRCFKPKRLPNPTVLEDEELQSIKVPTLYLVGENEKIYSAQQAIQRLNDVAPHIRAEVILNAGHGLTIEQAEVVNGKVLEFLKQP
jgi:pimeloyl-ACP methyl ester carboxylesterase